MDIKNCIMKEPRVALRRLKNSDIKTWQAKDQMNQSKKKMHRGPLINDDEDSMEELLCLEDGETPWTDPNDNVDEMLGREKSCNVSSKKEQGSAGIYSPRLRDVKIVLHRLKPSEIAEWTVGRNNRQKKEETLLQPRPMVKTNKWTPDLVRRVKEQVKASLISGGASKANADTIDKEFEAAERILERTMYLSDDSADCEYDGTDGSDDSEEKTPSTNLQATDLLGEKNKTDWTEASLLDFAEDYPYMEDPETDPLALDDFEPEEPQPEVKSEPVVVTECPDAANLDMDPLVTAYLEVVISDT